MEANKGTRETMVQTLALGDTVFIAIPASWFTTWGRNCPALPYRYTIPITIAKRLCRLPGFRAGSQGISNLRIQRFGISARAWSPDP